jgi:TonB family protein
MSHRRPTRRDESRSALLVALLISLLLHQLIITAIAAAVVFDEPEAEERMEVSLLEEEQPEEEPTRPEPEIEPQPPPTRPPEPEQQPVKTPPPPVPEQALPVAGIPTAPPTPEPLGLPEPAPEQAEPAIPPEQVELEMDWAVFERTFAENAKQEREAYQQESQQKRRGGLKFGSFTGKVKRALHNHKSWVASGEQEPLGKRQRVFRSYIAVIHDRIHSLFADSFLGSLTTLDPSDPLNNFDLMAKLEFEILSTGHVKDLHVIRSSGNTVFDAAAVDSVYRSAPFHAPPREILSWNQRVYMRWGFYRNSRKCGVFNAEPYILRAPGSNPEAVPAEDLKVDDG